MSNRVIQNVLNLCIDGVHYHINNPFMCNALFDAECDGDISEEERDITRDDIHNFLHLFAKTEALPTLFDILEDTEYYREDELYIDIYRDWFKFKEEFIKKYPPKGEVK